MEKNNIFEPNNLTFRLSNRENKKIEEKKKKNTKNEYQWFQNLKIFNKCFSCIQHFFSKRKTKRKKKMKNDLDIITSEFDLNTIEDYI